MQDINSNILQKSSMNLNDQQHQLTTKKIKKKTAIFLHPSFTWYMGRCTPALHVTNTLHLSLWNQVAPVVSMDLHRSQF